MKKKKNNEGWPLAEPEPVTGPWVYTEAVYLLIFGPFPKWNKYAIYAYTHDST